MSEWGDDIKELRADLQKAIVRLKGDLGAKDYVVWLHDQAARRVRPGEVHLSFFGPFIEREADKIGTFDELFRLTESRVEALRKEVGL